MPDTYDVVVIGGGASGAALLYTLTRYTNIKRIALFETYDAAGTVNSQAHNNSQTLHLGDIETNYSIDKVRQVKPAALLVEAYTRTLAEPARASIIKPIQKMILAVGEREVEELRKRFTELSPLFPDLVMLDREGISRVEPEVMRGRSKLEPVLALFSEKGYAVNFGLLAASLIIESKKEKGKHIDTFFDSMVDHIERRGEQYVLTSHGREFVARTVVVDADAHSLGMAKKLGYGHEFSLIPIAGTFYFSRELLRGKVYTMQEPRLPFASVHGDPDITMPGVTRWGPTARFLPILESRKYSTMAAYFAASGLHRVLTWVSFFSILFEPIRLVYFIKNFFYEWPIVGKYFFAPQVRKIIPTIGGSDIRRARGFGGMRLQRVNTKTRELLLGEGKIVGDKIIFNMSPSPGASVCLYNAMRDAEEVMHFFGGEFSFDRARMLDDLAPEESAMPEPCDLSQPESYPS